MASSVPRRSGRLRNRLLPGDAVDPAAGAEAVDARRTPRTRPLPPLARGGLGEGFTTRNVAALCGVSHGMCHYHFQDRTDLVLAVVTDIRPERILPLEEAVSAPGPFAERAERVVELLGPERRAGSGEPGGGVPALAPLFRHQNSVDD